jgi:predicted amidohydrolase
MLPTMTDTEAVPGPAYKALALQVACRAVNACGTVENARSAILAAIDRLGVQLRASLGWTGSDTRLVVLPEYLLTGFPMGETAEEWIAKACLEPDGAEYEALARLAREHRIFLAGNAYETDRAFPGLFFQASFVLDPSGDTVVRYRRLNSMYSPTPHDVWSRYLDLYGLEGVFPVARTEIGALAAVASEEILIPEVSRCLALRGAEVLVHSSCETASPLPTPKSIARRARAIENLVYVVSCNTAGMEGIDLPKGSSDGGSEVVDFRGRVLAQAGSGESIVANAEVDLAALRRFRRRPGMENLLSRHRSELYAAVYGGTTVYPPDTLLEAAPQRDHFRRLQAEVIERLVRAGLI